MVLHRHRKHLCTYNCRYAGILCFSVYFKRCFCMHYAFFLFYFPPWKGTEYTYALLCLFTIAGRLYCSHVWCLAIKRWKTKTQTLEESQEAWSLSTTQHNAVSPSTNNELLQVLHFHLVSICMAGLNTGKM